MSLRDAILKASQKCEPLDAFGEKCTVRVLSGRERDQLIALSVSTKGSATKEGVREKLVALFIGDADGKRLFSDDEKDIAIVAALDSLELEKILEAGLKLNKLLPGALEETKKA